MISDSIHTDTDQKEKNNINLHESTRKNVMDDEEATVPKAEEDKLTANTPLLTSTLVENRRFSLSSTSSKSTDCPDICRICHCEGTTEEPLISPCLCMGTMQYLHQSCLQHWIKSAGVKSCELCKFEFIMHAEIKPFKQVSNSEPFLYDHAIVK